MRTTQRDAKATGFYLARVSDARGTTALLATPMPGNGWKVRIYRPSTGEADMTMGALNDKYKKVTAAQAQRDWDREFEERLTVCFHGEWLAFAMVRGDASGEQLPSTPFHRRELQARFRLPRW